MSSCESVTWKMAVLVIILASSAVGNIFVIVVVHRSRRNQWTTNHFVLNLALANLCTPILYLSMTIDCVSRNQWPFEAIGCKLWAFLGHFNAVVSVTVMCCMSFDRFYLTAYPLTCKLSKIQTKRLIFLIWLLAAAISSPILDFYELDNTSQKCVPKFSTNWTIFMLVFCFLFLGVHFATYVMYMKVYACIVSRNSKSVGLNMRFARKVPRTKIKVTKLLVAQVLVHSLLWLPFILYQITASVSNEARDLDDVNTVTLYMIYLSNAASPIIYATFSGDFRRGCKQIFTKYDASNAYRIPIQLERKHRVDFLTPDMNSGLTSGGPLASKRDSTEQPHNIMTNFEKHRQAWSEK